MPPPPPPTRRHYPNSSKPPRPPPPTSKTASTTSSSTTKKIQKSQKKRPWPATSTTTTTGKPKKSQKHKDSQLIARLDEMVDSGAVTVMRGFGVGARGVPVGKGFTGEEGGKMGQRGNKDSGEKKAKREVDLDLDLHELGGLLRI